MDIRKRPSSADIGDCFRRTISVNQNCAVRPSAEQQPTGKHAGSSPSVADAAHSATTQYANDRFAPTTAIEQDVSSFQMQRY